MEKSNLIKLFTIKGIYYLCTLIIIVLVGFIGGIIDILQFQNVIDTAAHLGYPLYFFTLLGIFKILGAIALLLPKKLDKVKQLAYFGFTFDFIFASFSHYSVGDSSMKVIVPLVFIVVLVISFILRDKYSY